MKSVKITNGFLIAIMVILMVLCFASVGLVVTSYFVEYLSPFSYCYLFIGESILGMEFLINGAFGKFPLETLKIVIIVIGLLLAIFCIICIRTFSKSTQSQKGITKRVLIPSIIFQLLFGGYFAYNGICVFLNTNACNKYLSKITVLFGLNLGNGLITIKSIAFSAVAVFLCVVAVLVYIVHKQKTPKKERVVQSLNFYSNEYLIAEEKTETTEELETDNQSQNKPEVKKQSQELINRIMQLNQLRDANQITDVEYTKLRTKAIKRYKG